VKEKRLTRKNKPPTKGKAEETGEVAVAGGSQNKRRKGRTEPNIEKLISQKRGRDRCADRRMKSQEPNQRSVNDRRREKGKREKTKSLDVCLRATRKKEKKGGGKKRLKGSVGVAIFKPTKCGGGGEERYLVSNKVSTHREII